MTLRERNATRMESGWSIGEQHPREIGDGAPERGGVAAEIDSAPHGMLWTHADEVSDLLVEFLAG